MAVGTERRTALGDAVRERRHELRLSQDALGLRVGVSGNAIGDYERGGKVPKREVVFRLAHALGVDVATLEDLRDAPPNPIGGSVPARRALTRAIGYSAGIFPVPVLKAAIRAWRQSNAWPHWTDALNRAVYGQPVRAMVTVRLETALAARIVGEMLERRARGLA